MEPKANTSAQNDAVRAVLAGPRHAARPTTWALYGIGGVFCAFAGMMFATGSILSGCIGLVGAAIFGGYARSLSVQIEGVQLVNTAVQHLTRGDHAMAEAMLAAVPARGSKRGVVPRAIANVRATISLYDGRLEESAKYATAAIQTKYGLMSRTYEDSQIAGAHAIRALAYTALGDQDRAKADADEAESSADATPEVIARAQVVRALLTSRAAYHEDAFRKYIAASSPLILEYAAPRERVLFRALRRMAATRQQKSVYREQGRMNDHAPSKLASWISFVAPDAAAYLDENRIVAEQAEDMPMPSGVPSDVRALRTARAGAVPIKQGRVRLLAFWALLGVMFLAIWQLLTPAPSPGAGAAELPPEADPTLLTTVLMNVIIIGVPVAIFAVLVTIVFSLTQKRLRDLSMARRLVALGNVQAALPKPDGVAECASRGYGGARVRATRGKACGLRRGDRTMRRGDRAGRTSAASGHGIGPRPAGVDDGGGGGRGGERRVRRCRGRAGDPVS